jgi:putative NADH-flavin reductase
MKVLFVGGSGNISTACSRLATERRIELVHFNRGLRRVELPPGVRTIHGDSNDRRAMAQALAAEDFDVVVNWIVFDQAQAAADVEMFAGKVKQYVFISTTSSPKRRRSLTLSGSTRRRRLPPSSFSCRRTSATGSR